MSSVALCGSRVLPSSGYSVVSGVVNFLVASGRPISVGCAAGADATVLSLAVAAGGAASVQVFAVGGVAVAGLPVKLQGALVLSLRSLRVQQCRVGLAVLPVCRYVRGLHRGRLLVLVRQSRLLRSLPRRHHKNGQVGSVPLNSFAREAILSRARFRASHCPLAG